MYTKQYIIKKFPRLYKTFKSNRFPRINNLFKRVLLFLQNKFPTPIEKNPTSFQGKIFCIGANKTGTSSLEYDLMSLGYNFGDFRRGEMLDKECYEGNFDRLFRFCEAYDAFQDIPFSNADYYKNLDARFPNSKFILTIRDSGEQWLSYLKRFHAKSFTQENMTLTKETLENTTYVYKGFVLDFYTQYFDYPNTPLYDKEAYIKIYEKRNNDIIQYFKDKPDQLLVINVKDSDSYQKLGAFLNIKVPPHKKFPYLNKI